ncbi:division/cell wall cluster transcriptional repressor MraZ [Sphingomonas immobilis]|uniref:Division/cell wall cluster transcriptional repressor MraZ n=1 Tax=Sphingomonas immobilis TaxID=3063997 RepID=A0ABT8ZWS6_9SPHN|nr:division/cell wall cluster transcriptional repressor MraZ [Sphingomonas sp. CA1-15]MDO7842026.1 division/cell wall cluster transcriptional repressor MraZ [Sphingomonas sp. CA1-15]
MVDRVGYQGDGFGLVDDKGRVAIPSSLRSSLAQNAPRPDGKDGGTVIIGVHQKNKCLVAYDPGFLKVLTSRLDAREAANTSDDGEFNYNIKRGAAQGEALPFDGSGRFIMPGFPRFHANIAEHAFFYGVIDYFEIWDPKTLLATEGLPEVMTSCCRYHCMQKGIVL